MLLVGREAGEPDAGVEIGLEVCERPVLVSVYDDGVGVFIVVS